MCFSLDNRENLDNVKNKWIPELDHYIPHVPRILVGTKLDIRRESFKDDDPSIEHAVLSNLVPKSKVNPTNLCTVHTVRKSTIFL